MSEKNPSEIVLDSNEPGTIRECITELSANMPIEEVMMLTDLKQPLKSGSRFPMRVVFAQAGATQIEVTVEASP